MSVAVTAEPIVSQTSSVVLSQPNDTTWSTVVKMKRKSQNKEVTQIAAPRLKSVKLRAPRSSVVVLTLQPGAQERGITYAKAITDATLSFSRFKLEELGISSLRCRRTATGARILKIPGNSSDDKADALARKLRESVANEDVFISRPTKCAEIRISGLDDSVTIEEVREVVVRVGGCTAESENRRNLKFCIRPRNCLGKMSSSGCKENTSGKASTCRMGGCKCEVAST